MISLEWIKDYIDISDQDLKELAVKITKAGINVEKVITNHIDNLVIGEVKECENHPNSDHLHVCQVDIGLTTLQIVCGASNVRKGIKVIVALDGAVLPGDFVIKKSKIRDVESNGMICALFELGLEEKTEENYNKGIYELSADAKVGEDPMKYMGLDDTLYELDIHKHRNNDCYYHIGFAYEIGAILNREVHEPTIKFNEINENINDYFNLKVETSKCPYYLAKMVKDVKIKESPDFIKKRLTSAGMRPINNVVDISNYVMLEYGQPMHFFDYDKLGNSILVREATENEKIITLDGKERILSKNDIVITDSEKPVCIAGVMGGENTEVDENTKTILIESAIFDAFSIRSTANRLNLKSEASIRYGKGLNYEYTLKAIERACSLLEEYADAKILSGIVMHDKIDKTEKIVSFSGESVNKLLGIRISDEDIEFELKRLGFSYKKESDKFIVTIPNRRLDIDPNVNDIAEEIGRLYGYNNLISTLPVTSIRRGEYVGDVKLRKNISFRLRTLGLNECKTYTLVSKEMASLFDYENTKNIFLPNPMSADKAVVRKTIIPSLLNVYEYNKARKVEDIYLYEISKTYDSTYNEDLKLAVLIKGSFLSHNWQNKDSKCDFYYLKGILENIFDYLGFKNRYQVKPELIKDLHPGISAKIYLDREEIGIIGRINPSVNADEIYVLELSITKLNKATKPLKYKPSSKYPSIVKDMAFILDEDILNGDIIDTIRANGGRFLTNIEVFDLYIGSNIPDGKKSIAYSLTFNSNDSTLNDEEITVIFNKIIASIEEKYNAVLRDK